MTDRSYVVLYWVGSIDQIKLLSEQPLMGASTAPVFFPSRKEAHSVMKYIYHQGYVVVHIKSTEGEQA